jgi:hypothetical protein
MTIFGFNTDAKVGSTVYHVQSEARVNDLLLQTQVWVKGQCIGKRASSYAEKVVQPDFSTEQMHELLKAQHRMMLEAVKEERVQEMFCTDGEVQDVNAGGLSVQWMNSDASFKDAVANLKLRVALWHKPVDGALITSRLDFTTEGHIHSQSMSDEAGLADLDIDLPKDGAAETAVLVRAKYDEKSVTRKFRVKRS